MAKVFDPSALDMATGTQPVSTTEDVVRSAGAGLRRGVEGIPGTPQDLLNLAAIGAAYVSGKLGASPETQETIRGSLDIPYLPSTEDIHAATSEIVGPSYEPQTTAGKYAATAGEFAPGFVGGGGGAVKQGIKLALGAGAGLASEAAGQATAGTALEPWVRAGAGIAGGAAPEAATAARTLVKTGAGRAAEVAAEDAAKAHGVQLTKGQRTGDVSQQRAEQEMLHGTRGSWAERLMQARERESLEAVKDASANVMDVTAPSRGGTPVESGGLLNQQTAARARQLQEEGGKKIQSALEQGVMLDPAALRGLPAELSGKLEGNVPFVPDVVLDATTPVANQAMDRVKTFVSQIEDPNIKDVSMAGAEQLRRQLGKLDATDPTDRRALGKIRQYFDDWYDTAIEQHARVMPDPNALPGPGGTPNPRDVLAGLKAGRATSKEGLDITRPRGGPPGGKQVSKIATEGNLPENTTRLLTPNDAGNLSAQAVETIDRLVKVGAGSADLDQVRGIILDRLLTGDPGKVATRVDNFFKNNPSAAGHLFQPDEIDKIKGLAATNKKLVPDKKATNPSKSSYGIVKESAKTGVRKVAGSVPIVGPIIEGAATTIGNVKGRREALEALKDANRDTLTKTIVKKGAEGGTRALPGSLQGARTMTVDDPGGPNDGQKVRIVGKTSSGKWRGVLPSGEEYVFGEKALK